MEILLQTCSKRLLPLAGWFFARFATSILIFLTVVQGGALQAEEIPSIYLSPRAAGMGDAFTAVANDEGAMWTNPAGVSRVRKARSRSTFHITKFPNVIAGANAEARTFYEGFKSAQEQSVESILDATTDLGDKPFWARAAVFPVTIFDAGRGNPVGFGVLSNTRAKAIIDKDDPTQARVEAISDQAVQLAVAYTNRTNRFSVGLGIRPTVRYAFEKTLPSEDLLNKDALQAEAKEEANKSQGVGADFGLLWTFADFWFPTVGIAVLNLPNGCKDDYLNPFTEKREKVCGNVYKGSFGNEEALSTVDPTDIRAGVSITPRLTRKVNLRFSLDVHHIAAPSGDAIYGLQGIEASKLIHGGLELFFGNPLLLPPVSFRAGYNQGFATFGASLNAKFFTLDFASYGQDVSSNQTPQEDRRYLGGLSFGF